MRFLLTLLTIVALATGVSTAEDDTAGISLSQSDLKASDHNLWLPNSWRFRGGDDSAWADPALHDADWETAQTLLHKADLSAVGWSGIGWFRLHIRVDSSTAGRRLGLKCHLAGAAEFYLDGELFGSIGRVGASPEKEETHHTDKVIEITFPSSGIHVIAVRYSNYLADRFVRSGHPAGYEMSLGDLDRQQARQHNFLVHYSSYHLLAAGVLVAFSLLHLLLFLFYPPARQNLFYCLFTASLALLVFTLNGIAHSVGTGSILNHLRLIVFSEALISVTGVRFAYSLFHDKLPRQFWLFLSIGLVLALLSGQIHFEIYLWFTLIALAEMGRVVLLAFLRGRQDAWIIGIGSGLFIIGTTHSVLHVLRVLPQEEDPQLAYLHASIALAISLSVYLARGFARTRRELERAHTDLEVYSNTLEEKVQERTREVNEKNAKLEQTLEELRATQNQLILQEKMASLGNLVAGVAHEINTPAGAVRSAADIASRCIEKIEDCITGGQSADEIWQSEEFQKVLGLLKKNNEVTLTRTGRIANIVRSLRNFARLDEANYQEVDIHEGLESTLILIQHETKNRITTAKEFGDVPRIPCYPNELNQVFLNILINAAPAIEGRGEIRIQTSADDRRAFIKISDNGRGIPPEDIEKVFNPGFTAKGVGVGTGLGLSISYNIIQKHGEAIRVESEAGDGTTFTIELPRKAPETDRMEDT